MSLDRSPILSPMSAHQAMAAVVAALALCAPGRAGAAPVHTPAPAVVDSATWADHDAHPIAQPKKRETPLYPLAFHQSVIEPLSHAFDVPDKLLWLVGRFGVDTEREAVNVNAFDEVPNSTWFTNRNHVRALSLDAVRSGPFGDVRPRPPYRVTKVKAEGITPGFTVVDADHHTWVVKLDPPGGPQLPSGADVVTSRLLYAAGYNLPHDETFKFRRADLALSDELAKGQPGDPPLLPAALDALLARGNRDAQGVSTAQASLFLPGKPIGNINMSGKRPDDVNDWFSHRNRRELRGLYVLMSWLNSWDVKDQQSFDSYVETAGKGRGHVDHYLLDVSGSLGAQAEGAKTPERGYAYTLDWSQIAHQFVSFGFVPIRWHRAQQATGIPSVGNFESVVWEPNQFRPLQPHAAFDEMTPRDGYWGAKLVASFNDAQIRAAVEAARYDDPRASTFLVHELIVRRDKTARYWFDRVAPLDFFEVRDGALRFHDLALDLGLATPRAYEVRVRATSGGDGNAHGRDTQRVNECAVALDGLDAARGLDVELKVAGSGAAPAHVRLVRGADGWAIARVEHG